MRAAKVLSSQEAACKKIIDSVTKPNVAPQREKREGCGIKDRSHLLSSGRIHAKVLFRCELMRNAHVCVKSPSRGLEQAHNLSQGTGVRVCVNTPHQRSVLLLQACLLTCTCSSGEVLALCKPHSHTHEAKHRSAGLLIQQLNVVPNSTVHLARLDLHNVCETGGGN